MSTRSRPRRAQTNRRQYLFYDHIATKLSVPNKRRKDANGCPVALLPEEPFRPCNSLFSRRDLPKEPLLYLFLRQILRPTTRQWHLHPFSAKPRGPRKPSTVGKPPAARDITHRLQAATTYPLCPLPFEEPSCASKIFFLPNAASPSAEPAPTLRTSLSIRTAPPSEPPPAVPSRQPFPQSGDLRHQLRPNRVAASNQPSPQPADPPCVNKPPAPTLLTKAAKRKLRLNKMFRMRAARPAVPHAAPGPEHRAGSAGSGAGASKQGTEPMPEEEIEVIFDLLTESDSSRPASPADAQLRTPPFPRRSPAFAPRSPSPLNRPAFLRRRPLLPSLALCVPPWRGHAPRPMEPRPMPPCSCPCGPQVT